MAKIQRVSLETIRREEILQAALKVISERGSANVTLEDIAKAYGCSKGGITYYYASKEALIKDVFVHFFNAIFERTQKELDRHDNPLDKMLSYAWFFDETDTQTMLMYPLLLDVMSIAAYNADYRQEFHEWLQHWGAPALAVVLEGKEKGIFRVDDASFAIRTVAAAYHGIATRWYLDRNTYSTDWAKKALHYTVINLLQVDRSNA